jgi:hypothetical protein
MRASHDLKARRVALGQTRSPIAVNPTVRQWCRVAEWTRELFLTHRDAERARDFDAIMRTFSEDCYLKAVALGSQLKGRRRDLDRAARLWDATAELLHQP